VIESVHSTSPVSPITPHVYEVRPRNDKSGVDLISDVLPFGRLWYGKPNAIFGAHDLRQLNLLVIRMPHSKILMSNENGTGGG
jgi:hypothetical protein